MEYSCRKSLKIGRKLPEIAEKQAKIAEIRPGNGRKSVLAGGVLW